VRSDSFDGEAVVTTIAWGLLAVLFTADPASFPARDTLAPAAARSDAERLSLEKLTWKPGEFSVTLAPVEDAEHQAVIRFPSALETGDAVNDKVALLWYRAAGATDGEQRPALVVVHESGAAMPVGKMFAKGFAARGVHAFLIHLPYYGLRKEKRRELDEKRILIAIRQGIADTRRAHDAVAVLPGVDPQKISLQGTSLGGFVAATTAGLDRGYDQVFIMVAGGDLPTLLAHGQRESADLKRRLDEAGWTGEKLREVMATVEPNVLASRINAERTWLYSANQDQVVPIENALSFKRAAHLSDDHHICLWGDHVTTILYFPVIADHVVKQIMSKP
jgi:dienelactone hydrolase